MQQQPLAQQQPQQQQQGPQSRPSFPPIPMAYAELLPTVTPRFPKRRNSNITNNHNQSNSTNNGVLHYFFKIYLNRI